MNDLSLYGINQEKGRSYENIIYVLALVYNLINGRVENYFAPHGLSAVQFNVLMLAAYQNGGKGITQTQIAKHLIASASNVTKLVEKSVKKGLLTRTQNPASRRENLIRITAKGQKVIDHVWPQYDVLARQLTDYIPAKEQKKTAQILNNWLVELQKENSK